MALITAHRPAVINQHHAFHSIGIEHFAQKHGQIAETAAQIDYSYLQPTHTGLDGVDLV